MTCACPLCGKPLDTDGIILAPEQRAVIRNKKVAVLTGRAYSMFECLYKSFGKIVSRDSIMTYIYGLENDEPDWHILQVLVHQIRKRTAPLGFRVDNVHMSGYVLRLTDDA